MLNKTDEWTFIQKSSRPPLTDREVSYWLQTLRKLLKVGIEVELNLPEKNGTCDRQNFLCECVSVFKPEKPMPDTELCYEQCLNWDDGNCPIAKEHGCAGIYCTEFRSPCPSCNLYDRGCDSCPELYSIHRDPRHIRQQIGKDLKPTRFVGEHGETGVYKVCRDGSLQGDGGIEIATVGRRVQFLPLYDMVEKLIGRANYHGAYTNQLCSVHVHLLASYLTPEIGDEKAANYLRSEITEMEKPMPEIILANYHQLVRRYQCALIWLSAAGDSENHMTRWEKFRKSILPYSAARYKMPLLVKEVGSASKSKRKYSLMNYEPVRFNDKGQVTRLHVEGRYMDGSLSPATIVSHACLLYGLMLKAVEISRYGIIESGNKEYMDLQKEIYKNLSNNDGPWDANRHSDTRNLTPFIQDLRKQSREMVRLVKGTLSQQAPADEILSSLAEKPAALRLIEGRSWEEIEVELMPEENRESEVERYVTQLIDITAITECDDREEWIEAATHQLANERGEGESEEAVDKIRENIRSYISQMFSDRRVFWSREVGGYVANR